MTQARGTEDGDASPYLNDTFRGKDVGLDLGQVHEAQVQCAIRLGPGGLELLHGPTQHPLDPVIVALQLGGLNLVQQHGGRDCGRRRPPSETAVRSPRSTGQQGSRRNSASGVSGLGHSRPPLRTAVPAGSARQMGQQHGPFPEHSCWPPARSAPPLGAAPSQKGGTEHSDPTTPHVSGTQHCHVPAGLHW